MSEQILELLFIWILKKIRSFRPRSFHCDASVETLSLSEQPSGTVIGQSPPNWANRQSNLYDILEYAILMTERLNTSLAGAEEKTILSIRSLSENLTRFSPTFMLSRRGMFTLHRVRQNIINH